MSRLPKLGPAGGHGTASAHAKRRPAALLGPFVKVVHPSIVGASRLSWFCGFPSSRSDSRRRRPNSSGRTAAQSHGCYLGQQLWASCSPAFWGSGLSSARLIRTKRAATDARQGTAPKIPWSQLEGRSLVHPLTRTTDSQTLRAAPGGRRKALDHRSLDARVAYQERRGLRAGLSQEAVDRLPARPSRS